MRRITTLLLLSCCLWQCENAVSPTGTPTYPRLLQEWLDDPATARLIDFSYAGYQNGLEKPSFRKLDLPVFEVTAYGALPDDGKDDIEGIQRAIDAAAQAGGGIVKVPPGQFDFDVNTTQRFLHIHSSNIILLGGGEGLDGTTIFDHSPSRTPDPKKPWLAGLFPSFVAVSKRLPAERISPLENPENVCTLVQPARRGTFTLTVEKPENLQANQTYLLTQQEVSDSSLVRALTYPLERLGQRQYDTTGMEKYKMQHLVRITKIQGNTVSLEAPLLTTLEARWKPQLWAIPDLLQNVAVIGFRLKNDWQEEFYHHLNGMHDNGYNGVSFSYVENGWVQALIAYGTSAAVGLNNCRACSVFDVQVRGNPGHNGFVISEASTRNLVYHCRAGQSMHSFSVSGSASGNVFYNCGAEEPSAIDLHSGLGRHNLFDNLIGPTFKHGGNPRSLPPALGQGQVFWNWKVGRYEPYKGKYKASVWDSRQLPGFLGVGVQGMYGQPLQYEFAGRICTGDLDSLGTVVEQFGAKVEAPASLLLFQRERRLGEENVFTF